MVQAADTPGTAADLVAAAEHTGVVGVRPGTLPARQAGGVGAVGGVPHRDLLCDLDVHRARPAHESHQAGSGVVGHLPSHALLRIAQTRPIFEVAGLRLALKDGSVGHQAADAVAVVDVVAQDGQRVGFGSLGHARIAALEKLRVPQRQETDAGMVTSAAHVDATVTPGAPGNVVVACVARQVCGAVARHLPEEGMLLQIGVQLRHAQAGVAADPVTGVPGTQPGMRTLGTAIAVDRRDLGAVNRHCGRVARTAGQTGSGGRGRSELAVLHHHLHQRACASRVGMDIDHRFQRRMAGHAGTVPCADGLGVGPPNSLGARQVGDAGRTECRAKVHLHRIDQLSNAGRGQSCWRPHRTHGCRILRQLQGQLAVELPAGCDRSRHRSDRDHSRDHHHRCRTVTPARKNTGLQGRIVS